MSPELYLAYLLACIVIIIVPGPTVTLIIANSLTHGTRAGLLNVAGTQIGIALMIALVAVGLASLIEALGWWFDWLRLAGAAYLVWLGIKLLRTRGLAGDAGRATAPRGGFLAQGFLVAVSNPKTLAIHRSRRRLFSAGGDHGGDGGGRGFDLRRALCRADRRSGAAHLAQGYRVAVADQRRVPDRRRAMAGVLPEPLRGGSANRPLPFVIPV